MHEVFTHLTQHSRASLNFLLASESSGFGIPNPGLSPVCPFAPAEPPKPKPGRLHVHPFEEETRAGKKKIRARTKDTGERKTREAQQLPGARSSAGHGAELQPGGRDLRRAHALRLLPAAGARRRPGPVVWVDSLWSVGRVDVAMRNLWRSHFGHG